MCSKLGRLRRPLAVVGLVLAMVLAGQGSAWAGGDESGRSHLRPGGTGVGDPYYPVSGNGGYDVGHYDLQVQYDPASHAFQGVTTIRARATQNLSRFDLDLVGLTVRSVVVDRRHASWVRFGQELIITPRRPLEALHRFTVVVRYDGIPTNTGLNGGGFFPTDDGAIIAGEPEVAAMWYPVNDHPLDKATYTFHITVPSGLQVVANGLPAGQSTRRGWTTFRWQARSPMASYLATVDIGHWNIRTRHTRHGLPIIDAVDPDVGTAADASLAREPEMLDLLQESFGRYPFETAGAIVDDLPLLYALETQTRPLYPSYVFSIGMGDIFLVHELAHQWFGDSVSVARWQDIWLNEGFATYAEWIWSAHVHSATVQQSFELTYARRPADDPFWRVTVADPGVAHLFDAPVYERGAMALQALRIRVGDKSFFRILRRWAEQRSGGNGTTAQFIELAEHVSGVQLDGLFRAWLYTPERPPLPSHP